MLKLEQWRDVVGYEGLYQVSDYGRVQSLPRNTTSGGILKKVSVTDGRGVVHLSANGVIRTRIVAHLVAEAFLGPRPEGLQVCHKNDVNTDDRLENLYHGTWKDNCADMVKNGHRKGRGRAKLTVSQVLVIKQLLQADESASTIAVKCGVTLSMVRHIKYGENWGWLT